MCSYEQYYEIFNQCVLCPWGTGNSNVIFLLRITIDVPTHYNKIFLTLTLTLQWNFWEKNRTDRRRVLQ